MSDGTSRPPTSSMSDGRPTTSHSTGHVPPPSTAQSSRRRRRTGQRTGTRQGTAMSGMTDDDGVDRPEFYREGEGSEGDDEEYGYSDEEEGEGEVFAFARPGTAAPPGGLAAISEGGTSSAGAGGSGGGGGGGGGARTEHSQGDNLRPPPSGRPKTVAFSEVGSEGHPRGMSDLTGSATAYSPDPSNMHSTPRTTFTGRSVASPSDLEANLGGGGGAGSRRASDDTFAYSNPNASSYANKTPRVHGRMSIHQASLSSRRSRSRSRGGEHAESEGVFDADSRPVTALSHQPSFASGLSYATTADDDKSSGSLSGLDYKMRSMERLHTADTSDMTEFSDGTSRPTTQGGTVAMSQFPGSATIPDGMTTKGDGRGNIGMKWDDGTQYTGYEDVMDEEDSPFAEVRASVSNIDDPEMPVLTFRAWFIGISFVIFGSACNTFFVFRNPAPKLVPLVFQMLAYPAGKFLAWSLPIRIYRIPKWLGGGEFSFNPGPFNIKEHTLIVIMSNVSLTSASALHAVVAANIYYKRGFSAGFLIAMLLTTQLTGFGFAGVSRRFLVWPASLIWPYNLVIATNLNTFHAEDDKLDNSMTRFRFFIIAFCCAFAYYFLPGFLFTALSAFSWVCWIKPDNVIVNQLFGVSTGLGMGILTFDWAQISWIGSPLQAPWWAEVNIGGGFVLFYWILCPILYYNNVWYTSYLPMSTSSAVDRFGSPYNVSLVTGGDGKLDKASYELYSPVYIAITFCMTFMVAFALSTAVIVHTVLYHGARIWKAIRHVYSEKDDIHMKLMRNYPEVPDWWFALVLLSMMVLGIVSIEIFHTGLPVYALMLSILLPAVYFIPGGFIYAMTTSQLAINLIAELIPGYMLPNDAVSNMLFKAYSVQSLYSALQLTQDMKLGHYMKVPPRANFIAQFVAVVVGCFTQAGVKQILFAAVPDICTTGQKDLLTCPYTQVYYTASVLWGLIGPEKLFSPGRMYHAQLYALLAGAILPIPVWLYTRRYPQSIFKHFSLPVILNGVLSIPPASGINYASWLFVGFIFQYWIRRRYFAWWSKYNYTLSAALDVGTITSGVFVFLVLGLPGAELNWIGNTIYETTADWSGVAYRIAPEAGFGPTSWAT